MRITPSRRLATAILGLALAAAPAAALACPSCKEAVSANDTEAVGMAQGYNWSVIFMLSVPFSLFGVGGLMVRSAVKKGAFPEL